MPPKTRTPQASHSLIRQKMKEQGLTYRSLGKSLGLRPDKLSVAVTCSSGLRKSAIEMRHMVAAALGLTASEVWDEKFLTAAIDSSSQRYRTSVKGFKDYTSEEIEELEPRLIVRALLNDRGMTLQELAETLGENYKTLSNHVYGRASSNHIRERVASFLNIAPSKVWPRYFQKPEVIDEPPLSEAMLWMNGFGNMTKPPSGVIVS